MLPLFVPVTVRCRTGGGPSASTMPTIERSVSGFASRGVVDLEHDVRTGGDEFRRAADREVLPCDARVVLRQDVLHRKRAARPTAAARTVAPLRRAAGRITPLRAHSRATWNSAAG